MKVTSINISQISQRLADRRTKALSAQAGSPRIGIFWLHKVNGQIKLFSDMPVTPDEGEEFQGFVSPFEQHSTEWNNLIRFKNVPDNTTWEYLPRGRVLYHKIVREFFVVVGNWCTSQCESAIKNGFNLNSVKVTFGSDSHYDHFVSWSLTEIIK